MWRLCVSLVLALSVGSCIGDAAIYETAQEIVGGTNADIVDSPWQVSLQTISGTHFCGGVILSARWVITAQHCVYSASRGRVVAGITKQSETATGQIRGVDGVATFPGYVNATRGKDVTLLHLESALDLSGPKAAPIAVATPSDEAAGATNPGVTSTITGWGTVQPTPYVVSDILQTATVPIVSNAEAQADYPAETITADQLAAGYAAGGVDTCQGDSGGPLTVPGPTGPLLAGLTSWGYGCAQPNLPGLYARVSTFAGWITARTSGVWTATAQVNQSAGARGWSDRSIYVPAGTLTLSVVSRGGVGNADLYVRRGAWPLTNAYDCRSWSMNNYEYCSINAPTAGWWYISLYGYSAFSGVTITVGTVRP